MESVLSRGENVESLTWHRLNRTHDLSPRLLDLATDYYGELGIYESWDEYWCFADDPPVFCLENPAFGSYAHFFIYHWIPDEDSDVNPRVEKNKPFARFCLEQGALDFNAFEREVMEAGLHSQFTFFEILQIEPRSHLVVRDLFRNRTQLVSERYGAKQFSAGDLLYGRTLTLHDTTIFYPLLPLVFPAFHKKEIMQLKRDLFGPKRVISNSDLYKHDFEIRELFQSLAGPVFE